MATELSYSLNSLSTVIVFCNNPTAILFFYSCFIMILKLLHSTPGITFVAEVAIFYSFMISCCTAFFLNNIFFIYDYFHDEVLLLVMVCSL